MSENNGFTKEYLEELRALPLDVKILKSKQRIREWYNYFGGQVYVSFSGGKDSTVLLHLVRSIYPDVPAVYCDTGLEYPELKDHVHEQENVTILRPKMLFNEVITKYGYPIVGKEVAEAIYYARRILPEDRPNYVNGGEREQFTPMRKRKELLGQRETERGGRRSSNEQNYVDNTEEHVKQPICLSGDYAQTKRPHRGKRTNVRRILLTGNWTESRGDGTGVALSMFNKVKYLPLAQKAPFKIAAYCCSVMKKLPMSAYHTQTDRTPYLGTLTEESRIRKQAWIRHGCNAFEGAKKQSTPIAFWTEQDILEYIDRNHLPIPSVYGDIAWVDEKGNYAIPEMPGAKRVTTGCARTGCVFCGFGLHLEKGESRFQRLKRTHPKLYDYSIGGGQWIDNPDYVEGCNMEPDALGWVNWNPERIWVPDKKGLGMGFVFDTVNEIYGKEMMRYK